MFLSSFHWMCVIFSTWPSLVPMRPHYKIYYIFLSSRFSLSSWTKKSHTEREREIETEWMVNVIHLSMNSIHIISIWFKVKKKKRKKKTEWSAFLRFGILWDNVVIVVFFHLSFRIVCMCVHRYDLSFVGRSVGLSVRLWPFQMPWIAVTALYCKCTNGVWLRLLPFIRDHFCCCCGGISYSFIYNDNNKNYNDSSDECKYVYLWLIDHCSRMCGRRTKIKPNPFTRQVFFFLLRAIQTKLPETFKISINSQLTLWCGRKPSPAEGLSSFANLFHSIFMSCISSVPLAVQIAEMVESDLINQVYSSQQCQKQYNS